LSPILFDLYSEYSTKRALEGFEDFEIGEVILTLKYADELALLTKDEMVQQGTRIVERGFGHSQRG
jgi:hypothetical protein